MAVPRMTHETFQKSTYRPDPVQILIQQGEGRLEHLLPIRYGRMLASPFAFFRGAAAVMAWDLSHTSSTSLPVQLCGDAHVSNFGFFGSPERVLMFDMNDFDETLPGPFEWDVKRLAASVVLAGRSIGLSDKSCENIARTCIHQYRTKLAEFSEMTTLEIWYSHVTAESLMAFIPGAKKRKDVLAKMEKARGKDSKYAASKLTEVSEGESSVSSNGRRWSFGCRKKKSSRSFSRFSRSTCHPFQKTGALFWITTTMPIPLFESGASGASAPAAISSCWRARTVPIPWCCS